MIVHKSCASVKCGFKVHMAQYSQMLAESFKTEPCFWVCVICAHRCSNQVPLPVQDFTLREYLPPLL